jgi:hypothetical protein
MVDLESYPPEMSGISFVVDERGEAVMIDLEQHGSVWEDIHDLLVVRSRRREPRETLAEVEKRLTKRRRG